MKRVLSFAVALLVAACSRGPDYEDGFPTPENVRLEIPENSAQGLSGVSRQELQGAHSRFYDLTRGVTVTVNLGVGLVLGLVKAIVSHRPTSISGNTATWGPHTEALSPNTWKFTVTEVSPGTYEYKLEGKPKTAPDSSYVTVLSGDHTPSVDANGNPMEHFGAGQFLLDWDAAQTLPEHGADVGKASVTYSRLEPGADVTIAVNFTQVRNAETGGLMDAAYTYLRSPGEGGEFQFSTDKNVAEATAALEHLTIKSRWNSSGAGRSDVKATGGDLHSEATASECWDTHFDSQYMVASWAPTDPAHNYGVEATDCAFVPAEYASF